MEKGWKSYDKAAGRLFDEVGCIRRGYDKKVLDSYYDQRGLGTVQE